MVKYKYHVDDDTTIFTYLRLSVKRLINADAESAHFYDASDHRY